MLAQICDRLTTLSIPQQPGPDGTGCAAARRSGILVKRNGFT
jgi:hypothetical protein